jgi:hypothetical protein
VRQVHRVAVAHDDLGERVLLELREEVQARQAAEVVEAVPVLQPLHLRLEDEVEGGGEHSAEGRGLLGEAAEPEVDVLQAGDGQAVGAVRPVADAVEEVQPVGGRAGAAQHDQRRGRALVREGRRRGDRRVQAVRRHEVHERLRVAQAEAEVLPARVGLEGRVAGPGVELTARLVEARHAGVAPARQVDRGEVEGKAEQVVAQRLRHELVDLVARLTRHAAHDRAGGLVGGEGPRRPAVVVGERVEERLDQADVVGRAVGVGAVDRLVEHGVAEPVHGVGELRDDRRVEVVLVAGEDVDLRLHLAGELLEHEVLVLHLGREARRLEEPLAVPDQAGGVRRDRGDGVAQPLVQERHVAGRRVLDHPALDLLDHAVVLGVEDVVDRGQPDVLVAAAVAGDEVRVEHLVVVGRRVAVVGRAGVGVGGEGLAGRGRVVVVVAVGHRVVGDVVQEGVVGAQRVAGDRQAGGGALHEARGRRDLRVAVRAGDEAAVLVGAQQRDVEHVGVAELEAQHGEGLLLDPRPGADAGRGGIVVEQASGRHGVAAGVELVLAQEHLVGGVRGVGLVLVDEGRRQVAVLLHVVGALVDRRGRGVVAEDAVRPGLVGGARQHHEAQVRRRRAGRVVGSAGHPVGAHDERVVVLQGHEDEARAALGHQVEAVVEELAEEGEPRVERGREALVGRAVRDDVQGRGVRVAVVVDRRRAVVAGGRGDRRRVGRGLVDDQVAGQPGLGVLDEALLLLVAGRVTHALAAGGRAVGVDGQLLRGPERRRQHAREEAVRPAEVLPAGDDVVVAAVDRPHAEREQGVPHLERPVAGELAALGVVLADLDLLQHEVEVRADEGHRCGLARARADQHCGGQHPAEADPQATSPDLPWHLFTLHLMTRMRSPLRRPWSHGERGGSPCGAPREGFRDELSGVSTRLNGSPATPPVDESLSPG